ncbi:hypothetical protein NDU88_006225 [Pleurodeles waltl]|uniref:Uncharacterized protein n=1 Tax=Pleurodeles waltl TaxID=8319 RepID=A0AAV7MCP3_PLEWA|nr:hypothetical protein NDU88_006225 [Pleurodeles waltl]
MLGLLSIYAKLELEETCELNCKVKEILDQHPEQDEIKNIITQMEQRLSKYKREIQTKKRSQFLRDKQNYDSGHILTFGKKFDNTVRQFKQAGALRHQELVTSESGSETYSDLDEQPNTSNRDGPSLTTIDEYHFLQRN